MAQFTTQVATSIEQSQQLIELGVKPETADLVYRCTKSSTDSFGMGTTIVSTITGKHRQQ